MLKNESSVDRVIRLVIAAVAIAIALVVGGSTVVGIILFVVAAVMVVTAVVGFCPLYRIFGLRTNK
ncbi:MAG: DUF2892 domain-containing protein [Candidatus Nanopelagicales bacterium]|nr:DUF2892 domain-containing protein [Candidatus Nanopelagicales bacterium]